MRIILLCIFISLSFWSNISAQKIEQEKRIDRSEFPSQAMDYLQDHFKGMRKMKLYQETSTDSITYEAKFKLDKSRYSLEFFPNGQLLDIEKLIDFETIPTQTKQKITQLWNEHFKKHKVTRCQEQTSDRGIRYEIELKGKNKQGRALYEYLFEANGDFVQKREIILRTTDMTLY
jgi:hypothetical protein